MYILPVFTFKMFALFAVAVAVALAAAFDLLARLFFKY